MTKIVNHSKNCEIWNSAFDPFIHAHVYICRFCSLNFAFDRQNKDLHQRFQVEKQTILCKKTAIALTRVNRIAVAVLTG